MTNPIYAAHDDGFIYGLGPTPEEAEAEYRTGIGDDPIAASWGSITISEVTLALAAQVEAEGGAITWGINHRFELCTEDEEVNDNA